MGETALGAAGSIPEPPPISLETQSWGPPQSQKAGALAVERIDQSHGGLHEATPNSHIVGAQGCDTGDTAFFESMLPGLGSQSPCLVTGGKHLFQQGRPILGRERDVKEVDRRRRGRSVRGGRQLCPGKATLRASPLRSNFQWETPRLRPGLRCRFKAIPVCERLRRMADRCPD